MYGGLASPSNNFPYNYNRTDHTIFGHGSPATTHWIRTFSSLSSGYNSSSNGWEKWGLVWDGGSSSSENSNFNISLTMFTLTMD